jgi:O-antigen/teichoic acid export membrane protein
MADTVNIALMAVFAPRFARHFARMDRQALGRDLLESQAYGLLAYMPFVIAYYSFPAAVLSIVGPAFTQAAGILKIMTLGQMVNAATGPSTILLQMTKEESWLLRINVPSLALLALLMVGLGWRFGLAGAAWGYSLSVAVRNLAVYARARHTLRAPAGGGGG